MSIDLDQFWFDEEAADRVCAFFSHYLSHVKGDRAGEKFELADWQKDRILRPLFGWRRKDNGARRYRTAYIEVPRKNGKSTLCAGIALYLLLADGELGAEVYSAAADRDQASIVFDVAREMTEAHPSLDERCKAFKTRSMVVESTGSSYKALSADAYTKHGLNAHGIIFDELHAQPSRDLWDVLTTSVGARRQPLVVAITTAGHDRNSICWEQRDYAKKVADGIIEDATFLPVIFAADEDDDWTSPDTWRKANPALDYMPTLLEYLEQKCAEAQASPAKENTFKRLHLNMWTEQDVRWLQMAKWDACGGEIDINDLYGLRCTGGLDLASTTDIAALVLEFHVDGKCVWLPRFWIPRDNAAERQNRDRVPYSQWASDGYINTTAGNVIDYDVIRADIMQLAEQFHITGLAIDRWNSTQLQTQLAGDGIDVIQFGQGYASMSAPTKDLEALVIGGKLQHGDNPVLRWMASNVAVEMDAAGNIKPSKKRSTEKIDGIVAGVMAHGISMVTTESELPGVFAL